MTKIKICGLSRECDIDFVNETKPDYAGFVVNFPKSRRNVSHDRARELASRLSPEITPVGVFVDERPEVIAELVNCGVIRAAQLHGSEDGEYIKNLRALCRAEVSWVNPPWISSMDADRQFRLPGPRPPRWRERRGRFRHFCAPCGRGNCGWCW